MHVMHSGLLHESRGVRWNGTEMLRVHAGMLEVLDDRMVGIHGETETRSNGHRIHFGRKMTGVVSDGRDKLGHQGTRGVQGQRRESLRSHPLSTRGVRGDTRGEAAEDPNGFLLFHLW